MARTLLALADMTGFRASFFRWLALALSALGSPACGPAAPNQSADEGAVASSGGNADHGQSGGGGMAGAGEAGRAGEAGATAVLDPPWNEYSRQIEIECFGFFQGSMMFVADRDELSATELALVESLQRIKPTRLGCNADPLDCSVTITSDTGEEVEYQSNEDDGPCGTDERPALSRASVDRLRAAVDCKFAREDKGVLQPSRGCFHGLRPNFPLHQQLSLFEPHRRYHVKAAYCAGGVNLELFGADAAVPLAVGASLNDSKSPSICAALDVEVEEPLIADLVITPKPEFEADDFYLNFR